MERAIRIGKDFNVRWSIRKRVDGERQPYELAGKELVLQYRTPYGLKEATEWKVVGNTIVWTFRGKEQKALGSYELILTENGGKDGMVTVDTCRAFKLVAHSCEETDGSGSDIVIEDVVLETEVAFAALRGPQGESGPEGPQGPQGERGPQGEQGPAGPSYDDTEIKGKLAELSERIDNLPKGDEFDAEGNYPSLRVGTADTAIDLAGRGESVPASFGFRASGGKSIKDGRAYIKRIKGNSVVWNQLLLQTNNYTESGVTSSWNDNICTLSGESSGTYINITSKRIPCSLNEKWALIAEQISNPNDVLFKIGLFNSSNGRAILGNGVKSSAIIINGDYASKSGGFGVDYFGGVGTDLTGIQFKVKIISLTKMFGAGNEPTTIEDFYARVATLGVDEYAYNEGQVIHCNTESIKSVGDNAWDEEWELGKLNSKGEPYAANTVIRSKNFTRVIPNETYYFNGKFGYGIYFYDSNKNYVTTLYVNNNKLQIPSNAMYLKFNFPTDYGTTYKGDYMITLVHSGWKQDTDAGYQPYWQDILPLPIIRKYFPDGMKSAGTAHDEIRYNKASGKWEKVQRIGSVDMGSMAWSYDSANQVFSSYTLMDLMTHHAELSERNKGLLCSKYSPSSTYIASTMDDKSWLRIPKSVTIKDTSYTDAASFMAAMQGVMLYYELAEPIVTELDAEDQNFRDYYQVADFGTEQSQSSVPSAAFSADIIYQFNAVDMIREHELEINELQSIIATMQAQLASMASMNDL